MKIKNSIIGLLTFNFCLLTFALASHAATGCNYPSSLDTYVDKQTGDFLTVADINARSCAIEQLEIRVNQFIGGKSGGQTIKGGTGISEGLFLQATSGAGVGGEFVKIMGGNNGADTWATFNQGKLLMSTATPTGASAGDIVLANTKAYRFTVAAGTTADRFSIGSDNSNNLLHDLPATGNLHVFRWNNVSVFQLGYLGGGAQMAFIGKGTDPGAPSSGNVIVYHRDNGSGKGQMCARFPTGAIQCFATEP